MSLRKQEFEPIIYPESDGEPMAETDVHRQTAAELIESLEDFFQNEPEVYISGNILLYYVKGNPRKRVAPDVLVTRGIKKGRRRVYKLWEEGRPPDVVIEISSRQTWGDDLQRKWQLYEQLGVTEYFIFDPEYDYLMEPLVGYRLKKGEYVPLEIKHGRLRSKVLELDFVNTGETLRIFNPQTHLFLPTRKELEAARQQAEESLRAETEARQRAETELAKLREVLAKLEREKNK